MEEKSNEFESSGVPFEPKETLGESEVGERVEEEEKKVSKYFKKYKTKIVWIVLVSIAWLGYYVRTRNVHLLKDIVTGKFVPLSRDPHIFLRYAQTVVETGGLPAVDYMRYYPWGYSYVTEFKLLSFFIAYLFKFLHFFNSSLTLEKVHVLYPPIMFVVGLVFFFLLVRKLFDYKVALLSGFFLSVIPTYLRRTSAGFGDKEALGIALFFAGLYLFVKAWQEKKIKKNIIFGAAAGLTSALMGYAWGGVAFLISIIALFGLVNFVLLKFRKGAFFTYTLWCLVFYTLMIGSGQILLSGPAQNIGHYDTLSVLVLFVGVANYLILKYDLKNKLEAKFKLPCGIISLISVMLFGYLVVSLIKGPTFIFEQVKEIFVALTTPFGTDRWQTTISEAQPPYLKDLIERIGWKILVVYILGSILFVREVLKKFSRKVRVHGVGIYVLFILGFSFSRFSQNSKVLNGTSFFSQKIMYFGGIALLILAYLGYYFYTYYKDKESFKKILDLDSKQILVLVWMFILLVASRSAVRLLFIFSTIVVLFSAYFGVKVFNYSQKIEKKYYKIGLWVLLFLIFVNPFSVAGGFAFGLFDRGIAIEHTQISLVLAKEFIPNYNQQWQVAGEWVRENTPKEAVFANWWDYGYWVQTGWERATITDGGNAKVSLNHFMGRAVLTGQNEIEALEFLKAHNATHLLIPAEDLGKYHAFSSIGSDENWDRYSVMKLFELDPGRTIEKEGITYYVYLGSLPFDEDLKYRGEIFTKGKSFIMGFLIPTKEVNGTIIVDNPQVSVVKNGVQKQIPLNCVIREDKVVEFEREGLEGCFKIIPGVLGGNVNLIGEGVYLSKKVRKSLFTQMYLLNNNGKYFKSVYNDEKLMPLAIYEGRIIGPLKIWEVSYPEDLEVPEHYYKDVLPNPKVTSVEGRWW